MTSIFTIKDPENYLGNQVIREIAETFAKQLRELPKFSVQNQVFYEPAILDDIIAMGILIYKFRPDIDMNGFYRASGYTRPYPVHN